MQPTKLRGARTHNLRSIDLDIAPGTYLAIVGPSGAGKSSLAFRTLYAEGQRRYVESFSAYARQFLERLSRPPVDSLDPVPVGIAVDRQAPVRTSRSTVGTMTEIADYTKHLWAHAAELRCPGCGQQVHRDAPTRAAQSVMSALPGQKLLVTYPVAVADQEHFIGVREGLLRDGYRRVRIKDEVRDLDAVRPSDVVNGRSTHLDVVADRTVARAEDQTRLVEALEDAMRVMGTIHTIAAMVYRIKYHKGELIELKKKEDWAADYAKMLGLPPRWYKEPAYRSRIVREPRRVLAEMGLQLPPEMEVRVWDSSAEVRYLVLPQRPPQWAPLAEADLASRVTRDAMIGVARL